MTDPVETKSSEHQQPQQPQQQQPRRHQLHRLDQQRFLSQNAVTGEIMPNQWTLRQLCRILCPVPLVDDCSSSSTLSPQQQQQEQSLLQPKPVCAHSQLLAIESDGTYSSEGWKIAKEYPILKEAVALWHYQPPQQSSTEVVVGPVSCRAMAQALLDDNNNNQQDDNKNNNINSWEETTRVYSDTIGMTTWQTISNIPNLVIALEAFRKPPSTTIKTTDIFSQQESNESAFPDDASTDNDNNNNNNNNKNNMDKIHDELEEFLSSTDHFTTTTGKQRRTAAAAEEEAEDYESDGGTRYVKDFCTGNWVHEGLLPITTANTTEEWQIPMNPSNKKTKEQQQPPPNDNNSLPSRKRKRPKFSAKHAKCWIYISGLPTDCTVDELQRVFSKAGIIDLDPETQQPKIKIYRHPEGPHKGQAKGDASICYARPESVELAITLLDETLLRPAAMITLGISSSSSIKENNGFQMKVERAKFEQHGSEFDASKGKARVSNTKRQVAKLAAIQAMDWDDGEFNGRISGGRKGLRIIVIKNLFDPRTMHDDDDDTHLRVLEQDLTSECLKYGEIEKITVFASHPDGVVIVKFTKPGSAGDAVQALNGFSWKGQRTLRVSFWDGVSDYTVHNEEKEQQEMEQRHEEFGNWLEEQKEYLPQELRLKSVDE